MLRRVWTKIATTTATAGGSTHGGAMSTTFVRHMSRKRAENLQKINPKVPYPEALSIAQELFNLFHTRGPLTYGATWTSAQEAGVSGITSKTHMKLLIKWMRGKNIISQICEKVGSNKKFLLCTPDVAKAEMIARASVVKAPVKKQSQNKKKNKNK